MKEIKQLLCLVVGAAIFVKRIAPRDLEEGAGTTGEAAEIALKHAEAFVGKAVERYPAVFKRLVEEGD